LKIGLFDSGLGGLIVTHSLIQAMPEYDYVYLGDTARVPYGNRSQEIIYQFTRDAVDYLFSKEDCQLIILACNTASAEALRRIQQEYLPERYPERRVLGVLIPAAEATAASTQNGKVGVIATQGTVDSQAYTRELHKLNPKLKVYQQATPLLVPLVENNALGYAGPMLDDYLRSLQGQAIDTLILGCTHYPLYKQQLQQRLGKAVQIISQDDIIPPKLADYLQRHPEIDRLLSRQGQYTFYATDITPGTAAVARHLFGAAIPIQKITLT